jgi:hypothetical protein
LKTHETWYVFPLPEAIGMALTISQPSSPHF